MRRASNSHFLIADMTIELGQIECLLILGARESRFRQADFCLAQHDTEALATKIFMRSTGEDIAELLEESGERQKIEIGCL